MVDVPAGSEPSDAGRRNPAQNDPSVEGASPEAVRAVITGAIARLERRERSLAYSAKFLRCLFYIALAALVVLVVGGATWGQLLGPWIGAAALVALLLTLATRRAPLGLAKEYDDALALRDRLSSALAIDSDSPMAEHLRREALTLARGVDPARVHRFRMPREGYWLPAPLAAAALFVLLPGLLRGAPESNLALEELAASQRLRMDQVLSTMEKDPERFRDQIELLEELKSRLDQEHLKKKEALSELSEAMSDLEKQMEEERQQELEERKMLEQLARSEETEELADEIAEGDYQAADQELDELEKKLRKELEELKKENADPERQKALEEQLKRLRRLKAKLANLKNLKLKVQQTADLMDLMSDFEGEIGEIGDLDADLSKVVKLERKKRGCPT